MSIEQNLQRGMFGGQAEKTFSDKLFAKEDIKALQELTKKPNLTRSDLLEMLYLMCATEAKLVNYSSWDRYVQLKFFVWIREFVKIAELNYDYEDDLIKKESQCQTCNKINRPKPQHIPPHRNPPSRGRCQPLWAA